MLWGERSPTETASAVVDKHPFIRHRLAANYSGDVRCSESVAISVYLFKFVNAFYTGYHWGI